MKVDFHYSKIKILWDDRAANFRNDDILYVSQLNLVGSQYRFVRGEINSESSCIGGLALVLRLGTRPYLARAKTTILEFLFARARA